MLHILKLIFVSIYILFLMENVLCIILLLGSYMRIANADTHVNEIFDCILHEQSRVYMYGLVVSRYIKKTNTIIC